MCRPPGGCRQSRKTFVRRAVLHCSGKNLYGRRVEQIGTGQADECQKPSGDEIVSAETRGDEAIYGDRTTGESR